MHRTRTGCGRSLLSQWLWISLISSYVPLSSALSTRKWHLQIAPMWFSPHRVNESWAASWLSVNINPSLTSQSLSPLDFPRHRPLHPLFPLLASFILHLFSFTLLRASLPINQLLLQESLLCQMWQLSLFLSVCYYYLVKDLFLLWLVPLKLPWRSCLFLCEDQ